MPLALVSPSCGSLNPFLVVSPGSARYESVILIFGCTSLAPASNPAWNAWINGTLTPPMKPTLSVLVSRAAAAPTRYEPSFAAKINDVTLDLSTTESTMPNLMSGFSPATWVMGPEYANPIPRITFAPLSTSWSSRSTLAESGSPAVASSSPTTSTPAALA